MNKNSALFASKKQNRSYLLSHAKVAKDAEFQCKPRCPGVVARYARQRTQRHKQTENGTEGRRPKGLKSKVKAASKREQLSLLLLPSGSRLDGVKTENTAPAVVALANNNSVDSSESVSIHPRTGNSVYSVYSV